MAHRDDLKAPTTLCLFCPECEVTRLHRGSDADGTVVVYRCRDCDRPATLDLDP